MTDDHTDNEQPDPTVIRLPRAPHPTPPAQAGPTPQTRAEYTADMLARLQEIREETMEHAGLAFELHADRAAAVFKALNELFNAAVPDTIAAASTVDHGAVVRLLQTLQVIRERLDMDEAEALRAARMSGVPWEQLDTIYAPMPAAAAKRRYAEVVSGLELTTILERVARDDQ